jgi:hypothetical protein
MKTWRPAGVGLLGLLILSACGGPIYWRPDATVQEQQRDWVECKALSTQGSQSAYVRGVNQTAQRQLMIMCLESRGWQQISPREAEQIKDGVLIR